ncbi:MAG TPA: metal ABC transporter permease [bacterium]|nr:metal ABC transporter permease [bacterium]
MMDILQFSFVYQALIMVLILAPLFGLLSFFIVLRRLSFLGAGIAHSAFGGVALGVFFGINPFLSALVFCVFAAVCMGRIVKRGQISYDTLIGILFAFSMALGAVLIALRKAYTFDLSGYLFGNILAVTLQDLIVAAAVSLLFYLFFALTLNRLLFLTFEQPVAQLSGIRTELLETLFLSFLALIIVVSIKLVGIILVSALVVLPASFGLLLSKRYRGVMVLSVFYTLTVLTAGLAVSYWLDLPPGSTMVLLGSLVYFIVLLIRRIVSSH